MNILTIWNLIIIKYVISSLEPTIRTISTYQIPTYLLIRAWHIYIYVVHSHYRMYVVDLNPAELSKGVSEFVSKSFCFC